MRKNFINNKGFTLIELTVSIAVITILSAVSLVGFNDYNKKSKVDTAAYKLASDIRTAQNNALSLKNFGGTVPSGGWGVRLEDEKNYYILYADYNNDKKYTSGEDYQRINMDDGVIIEKIQFDSESDEKNFGYINHVPPNPDIFINSATNEIDESIENIDSKTITITLSRSGYERKIIVNKFGLVDVQ